MIIRICLEKPSLPRKNNKGPCIVRAPDFLPLLTCVRTIDTAPNVMISMCGSVALSVSTRDYSDTSAMIINDSVKATCHLPIQETVGNLPNNFPT